MLTRQYRKGFEVVKMTGITDGTSNTLLVGERPPSVNLVFGESWTADLDQK